MFQTKDGRIKMNEIRYSRTVQDAPYHSVTVSVLVEPDPEYADDIDHLIQTYNAAKDFVLERVFDKTDHYLKTNQDEKQLPL